MRRSADPDVEVDSSAVVQEIDTLSQAIAEHRLELAIMLVQTDITKSAERCLIFCSIFTCFRTDWKVFY